MQSSVVVLLAVALIVAVGVTAMGVPSSETAAGGAVGDVAETAAGRAGAAGAEMAPRGAGVDGAETAPEMVEAARAFLELLGNGDPGSDARFVFEDEERFNWHFVPRERSGLALEHMTVEQRSAAHGLLRSVLSSQGYLKATQIMFLESVLREIEERGPRRDPENYYLSVFGTPSEDEPWGWRFEGHHLSLNYTSVGDGLAVTPAFMGANPEEVTLGHATGLRVLASEEDLARALVRSLTASQLARAMLSETAPDDILTGNDRRPKIGEPEGLPASEMTSEQAALLRRVIQEYVHNVTHDVAAEQMARIDEAGFGNLHFAWAGSLDPDQPHYYRIQGPTVVFEYDNTQNGARHPHSVWRDLTNDFGEDLLKKHYDESHRR